MTEPIPPFAQRVQDVLQRLQRACAQAGRDPNEVKLLAVSKRHPPEAIREAWSHGLTQFGESYVQEWQDKAEALVDLTDAGLTWHIVGHLQRNKCKYIAGRVALIHSIDSLSLLEEIERRTPDGSVQPVLLQINVGQEESKSGWRDWEDALPALEQSWDRVSIQGLMTLPPYFDDPEAVRPFFKKLVAIRDRLQDKTGHPLPTLSMGMSHDLEVAIEEGSTCVRVGTALFGPRK